jgi:hypothetical protein
LAIVIDLRRLIRSSLSPLSVTMFGRAAGAVDPMRGMQPPAASLGGEIRGLHNFILDLRKCASRAPIVVIILVGIVVDVGPV